MWLNLLMFSFKENSLFISSSFILNQFVSFRHVQRNSENFRSEIRQSNIGTAASNKFNVLFEIVKRIPSNPIHQLGAWNIHVIIKPENDILSPTKLYLSDVNMLYPFFFLNLADKEFSSCSEKHNILLILHF